MSKPEFKLFPCVFCTIGFNSYVAVSKVAGAATKLLKDKRQKTSETFDSLEKAPSLEQTTDC